MKTIDGTRKRAATTRPTAPSAMAANPVAVMTPNSRDRCRIAPIVAVAFLLYWSGVLLCGVGILVTGPVSYVFQFLILVMISLQLSNLRYPKPSNKVRFFAPAVLVVLLLWALSEVYAAWIAAALVLGCLVYVLTGPMIHRRSTLRRQAEEK